MDLDMPSLTSEFPNFQDIDILHEKQGLFVGISKGCERINTLVKLEVDRFSHQHTIYAELLSQILSFQLHFYLSRKLLLELLPSISHDSKSCGLMMSSKADKLISKFFKDLDYIQKFWGSTRSNEPVFFSSKHNSGAVGVLTEFSCYEPDDTVRYFSFIGDQVFSLIECRECFSIKIIRDVFSFVVESCQQIDLCLHVSSSGSEHLNSMCWRIHTSCSIDEWSDLVAYRISIDS